MTETVSTPPPATTVMTPFTRNEHWTHRIAIASLILNGCGFLAVLYVISGSDEPIRSGIYVSMAQWTLDIDKMFIEHPHLRPFFYEGTPIDQSHPEYNRAISLAEMTIDTMDSVLQNRKYFPKGTPHKGWDNWINDNFAHSPIIREYMTQSERWIEGSELLSRWEKWKKEHPNEVISDRPDGK